MNKTLYLVIVEFLLSNSVTIDVFLYMQSFIRENMMFGRSVVKHGIRHTLSQVELLVTLDKETIRIYNSSYNFLGFKTSYIQDLSSYHYQSSVLE